MKTITQQLQNYKNKTSWPVLNFVEEKDPGGSGPPSSFVAP